MSNARLPSQDRTLGDEERHWYFHQVFLDNMLRTLWNNIYGRRFTCLTRKDEIGRRRQDGLSVRAQEVSSMKGQFRRATIVLAVSALCSGAIGADIKYYRAQWNGIPAHVVSADLNSPDLKVTVSIAEYGAGKSETFGSMVRRTRPDAAITGTFFCTRRLLPTGDIVIDGTRVHTGSVGKGICFTALNTVEFVPYKQGHASGWQGFETVLCAGPTLVENGSLRLVPRAEGFSDPALFGKKRRAALGVTEDNRLLMVVVDTPVYLRTLAKIMLHLGAVDAVDLDGGSSAAMYCNGRIISAPGRRLTNILAVYDNHADYYAHRAALAPHFRRPMVAPLLDTAWPILLETPFTEMGKAPANIDTHLELYPDMRGYLTGWAIQPLGARELETRLQTREPAADPENGDFLLDFTPLLPANPPPVVEPPRRLRPGRDGPDSPVDA